MKPVDVEGEQVKFGEVDKNKKPLKEWTKQEVTDVLKIFTDFDADRSGFIDQKELAKLCDLLGIQATIAEIDTFTKDGKIDKKEFFAFYVSCDKEEAEKVFKDYAFLFAPKKILKEWSKEEVTSVLKIFKDFDTDRSGFIEATELKNLCDLLCIEATMAEVDSLQKDGKVDKKEFFTFYIGCDKEEAEKAFTEYAYLFAPEKQLKEWSKEEVISVLKIFKDFDTDRSGFIDAKELANLCDLLCIDATVAEVDTLQKDGKIDKKEFFAFYVGCDKKEADKVFEDHADLFKN